MKNNAPHAMSLRQKRLHRCSRKEDVLHIEVFDRNKITEMLSLIWHLELTWHLIRNFRFVNRNCWNQKSIWRVWGKTWLFQADCRKENMENSLPHTRVVSIDITFRNKSSKQKHLWPHDDMKYTHARARNIIQTLHIHNRTHVTHMFIWAECYMSNYSESKGRIISKF